MHSLEKSNQKTNRRRTNTDEEQMILAYWNCAGGMIKKKHLIENILREENKIKLLFIAESEIRNEEQKNLLRIENYELITSKNDKTRLCLYIRNDISLKIDVYENETEPLHCITARGKNIQITGFYRDFIATSSSNRWDRFQALLKILKERTSDENITQSIIIGDMNIDWQKILSEDYQLKNYAQSLKEFLAEENLTQVVKEITRKRIVKRKKGMIQEISTLDHIYTNDWKNLDYQTLEMPSSDHMALILKINTEENCLRKSEYREITVWSKYCPEYFRKKLLEQDWSNITKTNDVNSINLHLENIINHALNEALPKKRIKIRGKNFVISNVIRRCVRKRKKALGNWRKNNTNLAFLQLKRANSELSKAVMEERKKRLKLRIQKNNKTLWTTVNEELGRNQSNNIILVENDTQIDDPKKIVEIFANFFQTKVENVAKQTIKNSLVENGKTIRQLDRYRDERIRFRKIDILNVLKRLKPKTCMGFDEIPMRIYKDGRFIMIGALEHLFEKINQSGTYPETWKVAKIVPLYKKGDKRKAENYRPISNINSIAKIYEMCLLDYIKRLEEKAGVKLTGQKQHGFVTGRSTTTALCSLTSNIASKINDNIYVGAYSCDLTAAFDLLDCTLLKKRLVHKGLPNHLIKLLTEYLTDRTAYVNLKDENSSIFDVRLGCVQGSTLGPVVFALFVSPLEEILPTNVDVISYADDSVVLLSERHLQTLKEKLSSTLRKHIVWLKNSGLVVNDSKTEIVIFHKKERIQTEIKLPNETNTTIIETKSEMKFLGLVFEQNLNWSSHIDNVLQKCKRVLFGLKVIRKYFNEKEFKPIIISLFYSRLYYCCEIWLSRHLPQHQIKLIENIHIFAIRIHLEDYGYINSKQKILENEIFMHPLNYADLALAKFMFKVFDNLDPLDLVSRITNFFYLNERKKHRPLLVANKNKTLLNDPIIRFSNTMEKINFDWYDCDITMNAFTKKMIDSLKTKK